MRRRAHTLIEVLLVMSLLALLYAILLYTVLQISQVSRRASLAAVQQIQVMKTSEQLRWQLRCLFSEKDPQPGNTTAANATSANSTSVSTRPRVGLIGEPGSSLLGQRGNGDGRDILLFITAYPKGVTGVVEVGYKLSEDGANDLLYRQFPVRDVGGFHNPQDHSEGPWTPLLRKVRQFAIDYSADGVVWQRDWDLPSAPRRVRVHLETQAGEVIDFQVTPAIGAARW